jgi:hypothetical protein
MYINKHGNQASKYSNHVSKSSLECMVINVFVDIEPSEHIKGYPGC